MLTENLVNNLLTNQEPKFQKDLSPKRSEKTKDSQALKTSTGDYGAQIGKPALSEEGKAYYEKLKGKFADADFILVSNDMKQQAKAHAGDFASNKGLMVLIGEEEIERMATDESFRKKYEGIISMAKETLKLAHEADKSGVKAFGMQVEEDGSVSYFAVMQKKRIEEGRVRKKEQAQKAQKSAEDRRADKKKAEKGEAEKAKGASPRRAGEKDSEVISAGSMEELLRKIDERNFLARGDELMTEAEKAVGSRFDFKL